jgi:hypothetical protein
MSYKINDAFILKGKSSNIVSITNKTNDILRTILEETLIENTLSLIIRHFVIFAHKEIFNSFSNETEYLKSVTKHDDILKNLISEENNKSLFSRISSLILFSHNFNFKNEFFEDIFIYTKTIGSRTYYVIDGSPDIIKLFYKNLNNHNLLLEPYDCTANNNYSNKKNWLKVTGYESVYDSMNRIQISLEKYFYKITDILLNKKETINLSEEEIKKIIYQYEYYLNELNKTNNFISSYIKSKQYLTTINLNDLNKYKLLKKENVIKLLNI